MLEGAVDGTPIQFQPLVSPGHRQADRRAKGARELRRKILFDGQGQPSDRRLVGSWSQFERQLIEWIDVLPACLVGLRDVRSPVASIWLGQRSRLVAATCARSGTEESACLLGLWADRPLVATPWRARRPRLVGSRGDG